MRRSSDMIPLARVGMVMMFGDELEYEVAGEVRVEDVNGGVVVGFNMGVMSFGRVGEGS